MLVFGENIQEAMDTGRFRHESGARVIVEPVIADSVITQLKAMGHEVTISRPAQFGGSQAIIKLPKGYVAGSDPRKDGHAAGY
jgi:gamma-glutamyltranspeptidase/glutathione hydrolase